MSQGLSCLVWTRSIDSHDIYLVYYLLYTLHRNIAVLLWSDGLEDLYINLSSSHHQPRCKIIGLPRLCHRFLHNKWGTCHNHHDSQMVW